MVVYYRLRIYNLWAYKGFPDGWAAKGFPGGLVVKDLPASAGDGGDRGSVFGLGRSPGDGNGSTLHYSCLETSMDRRTWKVTIHAKQLGTSEHPCTPQSLICSRNFRGWEKTLILQKRLYLHLRAHVIPGEGPLWCKLWSYLWMFGNTHQGNQQQSWIVSEKLRLFLSSVSLSLWFHVCQLWEEKI